MSDYINRVNKYINIDELEIIMQAIELIKVNNGEMKDDD